MKIVFIGAGNLATNLAKALYKKDFNIVQVFSRTLESAKVLANMIEADYTNFSEEIYLEADMYFVAVKDDAIKLILTTFNLKNDKIIVHCSGSTEMDILSTFSKRFGVFYPLQTFSKTRELKFNDIPIFLEASNQDTLNTLSQIAYKLTENVQFATSEQRLALHIAAVFSCNFVNYLYTISSDILEDHHLNFQNLLPLINETANKVNDLPPVEVQTGPAIRYDKNIIDKHLNYLSNHPELSDIYKLLSNGIYNQHKR